MSNETTDATRKTFVMHPALLWDVITRQAGTLGKALLEGVMNSIDAGATQIDLTIGTTSFKLTDNGKGFGSEAEVNDFFATFGQPHKEGDARFGRFRMGRGQMFCFARTRWTSNSSQMDVDIKKLGLDFHYRNLATPEPGCTIVGDFYDILAPKRLLDATEEVIRNCKHVDIPLRINGQVISADPAKAKWTHTTKEAYFTLKSGGSTGIDVYQQGVFVENLSAHEFGLSGTVVTRVGFPLKVNFARNQVIRDCPLFTKILKQVGVESRKRLASRKELDDSERAAIIAEMRNSGRFNADYKSAKIFRDVTGRWHSARQLGALFGGSNLITLSDGIKAYSVASEGDRVGDRIMQSDRGFVFDARNFEELGGNLVTGLKDVPWFTYAHQMNMSVRNARFVPLNQLAADINTTQVLLNPDQLSAREKLILSVAKGADYALQSAADRALGISRTYRWNDPSSSGRRTLRVGVSTSADGWTDGSSYISISRAFMLKLTLDAGGFASLGALLLHEYIHTDVDSGTHVHSPSFYRAYHDASASAIGHFVNSAITQYRNELRTMTRKKNRTEALEMIRVEEEERLVARHFGTQPSPSLPETAEAAVA